MREFITAAEEADKTEEEDTGTPFTVDGVLCRAFRPGDGQFAVLMATSASHSSHNEQLAGIINFFASTLDDQSHSYIVGRLLDRRDRFGIKQVQDIMEGLVEEWSANPTPSPSASTPSQRSIGEPSTAQTPALT